METQEQANRITLHFMGFRQNPGDKVKKVFYYLKPDGETMAFDKALCPLGIGNPIEVTPTATGVKGPYVPKPTLGYHTQATQWFTEQRVAMQMIETERLARKNPDGLEDVIERLRSVTRELNRSERAALMFYIQSQL